MNKDETQEKNWDPSFLFNAKSSDRGLAVIVLNQPIAESQKTTIRKIWCKDGGANRLYDAFGDSIAMPHEVRGDLDSIRDEVKEFYSAKNVKIVKAASQYATDLQKCILRVEEAEEIDTKDPGSEIAERMDIVIIGGLSGRFDQTMHTLHVLCQVAQANEEVRAYSRFEPTTPKNKGLVENDFVSLDRRNKTWVLSENSLVWILTKGSHRITIDLKYFGPTCGLLPFVSQLEAEPLIGTKIWTKGLEWDLDGTPSAVGSFLSTSNHLKEDLVQVRVDKEILWTMEIRDNHM